MVQCDENDLMSIRESNLHVRQKVCQIKGERISTLLNKNMYARRRKGKGDKLRGQLQISPW